jgi:hypothetical protein
MGLSLGPALLIDIERKNRLLKVCYVPTTTATFLAFFLFFLLWPLTELMKQTRQAVRVLKQSILLRCLLLYPKIIIIDIESLKIDCLRFVVCPLLAPAFDR